MPIEKVGLLGRARYVVDLAVHEFHAQLLAPVFASSPKSEQWYNLFFTFPGLQGEKAFLRDVDAFRKTVPPDAQSSLDSEITKVKAAYSVARKLKKNAEAAKARHSSGSSPLRPKRLSRD